MIFNYKFCTPLIIHTTTGVEEIAEINIDLNELTISDLIEVEKRYTKIIDGNVVPVVQREYTNCYHASVLEVILKKQYPKLLITSKDIENIKGEDARNLLFTIKSLYLNIFLEQSIKTIDSISGDNI